MWTCPTCGREFQRTNQSHYCGKAPETVDEYVLCQNIRIQPVLSALRDTLCQNIRIQPVLSALRDTICAAIPDAEEGIAWSMPTWKKRGNIIHFAANKNHLGVYVGEEAVEFFSDRLKGLDTSKGSIRLKYDQKIPHALIAEIAKWSFAQDQKL